MKTVIVTGASSGIGAQISQTLDQAGFQVILVARDSEKLAIVASSLKNSPIICPCDLSKPEEINKLSHLLDKPEMQLCGLINNAGLFIREKLENTTIAQWDLLYKTNLLAPALLAKLTIPYLKKSTQPHKFIINISSTASERAVSATGAYGALKASINHMTKVMALELGEFKICVNCVSPGIIDTPIHSFETLSPEEMEPIQNLQALGRIGQPQDIASLVEYLSDLKSNWITGSIYIIDGGLTVA